MVSLDKLQRAMRAIEVRFVDVEHLIKTQQQQAAQQKVKFENALDEGRKQQVIKTEYSFQF